MVVITTSRKIIAKFIISRKDLKEQLGGSEISSNLFDKSTKLDQT